MQPAAKPDEPEQLFNSALLISPEGTMAQRYDKVHLVPWGEYIPFSWAFGFAKSLTHEVGTYSSSGAERTPLEVGSHRYGVFICYESVFPQEVRQFAEHGAEVFVNISNDGWFGDSGAPWQHLNMARMRAVENHRWLLRSTNTGITASDRSTRTGGCGRSPEPASGAGCTLWSDERHDILYALRRLVSDAMCHNLNHGIAVARAW